MQGAIDACFRGVPGCWRLSRAAQIIDDAAAGKLPMCQPIWPRTVLGWTRREFVTFAPTAGDQKPGNLHT